MQMEIFIFKICTVTCFFFSFSPIWHWKFVFWSIKSQVARYFMPGIVYYHWIKACSIFFSQIPEKIVHSSAHLLLSITTTVRPQFLLHLSSTQTLCKHASQGAYDGLNMEVCRMLAMTCLLIVLHPFEVSV